MVVVGRVVLFCLALVSNLAPLYAVDAGPIHISERWSVVGVISGHDAHGKAIGIAVLRNNQSKRTFTLSLGDGIPAEYGYAIKVVKDHQVVISDGRHDVALAFAESAVPSEEEETVNSTARFLDTYYRSLNGSHYSPVEEVTSEDANEPMAERGDEPESTSGIMPMRRYKSLRDHGEDPSTLYRSDRTFRFEPEGDTASPFAGNDDGVPDLSDEGVVIEDEGDVE